SHLDASANQDVRSGGTSLMTTVLDGSQEVVAGIAISTVVDSDGMLNVSGGTAISAVVFHGGSAVLQAQGVALGIGVGGTLKLSAGGTAIDADFDGLQQIFSGATDIRGSFLEGSQTIFAGSESDDADLGLAGQTVSSGGLALRTILKILGEEVVLAGGTSAQTSVLAQLRESGSGRAVASL